MCTIDSGGAWCDEVMSTVAVGLDCACHANLECVESRAAGISTPVSLGGLVVNFVATKVDFASSSTPQMIFSPSIK